jgi:acyl-CoA synthetase (AMP-forming)/AMP-acid ligase II
MIRPNNVISILPLYHTHHIIIIHLSLVASYETVTMKNDIPPVHKMATVLPLIWGIFPDITAARPAAPDPCVHQTLQIG